jgi:dephospho-CoA kinase
MRRRLRIGLTGGIASGKSAAVAQFRGFGVAVIDADESARRVVAPGTPGLTEVVGQFGQEVLDADGTLNRRRLRALIFADSDKRRALESILHPLIRADMEEHAELATGSYVVLAIPLLIESGSYDRIDRILVVDVTEEIQLQRVLSRDGGTADQARAIIAAQAGRERRLQAADDVLDNSGTLIDLRRRVDELHRSYLQLAAGSG